MTRIRLSIALMLVGLVAGCANGGPNQTGGTLMGAAAGGLIGAQFGHGAGNIAATAGGALLGGIAGSAVGADIDRANGTYRYTPQYIPPVPPLGSYYTPAPGYYYAPAPSYYYGR